MRKMNNGFLFIKSVWRSIEIIIEKGLNAELNKLEKWARRNHYTKFQMDLKQGDEWFPTVTFSGKVFSKLLQSIFEFS